MGDRKLPAARKSAPSQQVVNVPLKWSKAGQVPLLYSNEIFVRLLNDVVHITFGVAELPHEVVISKDTEERLRKEGLEVSPVVRLVITPQSLRKMVDHLSTVLERWEKMSLAPVPRKRAEKP